MKVDEYREASVSQVGCGPRTRLAQIRWSKFRLVGRTEITTASQNGVRLFLPRPRLFFLAFVFSVVTEEQTQSLQKKKVQQEEGLLAADDRARSLDGEEMRRRRR